MSSTQYILRREFTPAECEERKGPGGFTLTYVAHFAVIDRLIEAVGIGNFQWKISSVLVADNMVTVAGDLTLWVDERWVTNSGVSTEALKGNDLEKSTKTADTDALKRAARLFGVGLHLYCKGGGKPAAKKSMGVSGGTGGPTEPQKRKLYVLAGKQDMSPDAFADAIVALYGNELSDMDVAGISNVIAWLETGVDLREELQKRGL
tara:strand:+ start:3443 stop:4060 length:618 start_codon:yes stop_codon:yes gene_type:complete